MVASEPNTGQELAAWLRQECERLRAEAGDDPVAWLRARMDEAERLQDEWMADDAFADFAFATFNDDGSPDHLIPDDVQWQRLRILSVDGRRGRARGLVSGRPLPPPRLSPRGVPFDDASTPEEDWEDVQVSRERANAGRETRWVSYEELQQKHPEFRD